MHQMGVRIRGLPREIDFSVTRPEYRMGELTETSTLGEETSLETRSISEALSLSAPGPFRLSWYPRVGSVTFGELSTIRIAAFSSAE